MEADQAVQAADAADVMESALESLARLPGAAEDELRTSLEDLRSLPEKPGAGLVWALHKSTAVT